jgi:hypothetical protein
MKKEKAFMAISVEEEVKQEINEIFNYKKKLYGSDYKMNDLMIHLLGLYHVNRKKQIKKYLKDNGGK